MSAPIVYEGALAPKRPNQNALFKGKKFWVAQLVPSRMMYVQHIQDNGGRVVSLDTQADFLIYDHLRKDAPSGPKVCSYKFIDDSIKAGILQDREKYSCHHATHPKKATKTNYTPEEDLLIQKFVTQKEREGQSIGGNAIYKEFGAKYPQHTWQSWRDRWIKKLQALPRRAISGGESSSPSTEPAKPDTKPSAYVSEHLPEPHQRVEVDEEPAQRPVSPQPLDKFTDEDDTIITQHIQESIKQRKNIQNAEIFVDLAKDYPQHSSESWRAHWLQNIAPKYEQQISLWGSELVPDKLLDSSATIKRQRDSQTSQSPGVHLSELEAIANQTHPMSTTNGTPAHYVIRTDPYEPDNQEENQQRQPPIHDQTKPETRVVEYGGDSPTQDQETIRDREKSFYNDYQIFTESCGVRFTPWLTIESRSFKIWDLWEAVTSQNTDPEERDWHQISEILGFDWVDSTIPDRLQQEYERHLSAFESSFQDFCDATTTEDDNEDEGEEETGNNENPESELALASSSKFPTLKRSFNAHLSSDHVYPQSSPPKRQRISRDIEIPSTPDNVNGTSHLRQQTSIYDSSPSASRAVQHLVDDESKDMETRDAVYDLPSLPRRTKKVLEPETQDFRFDPETQEVIFEIEEEEVGTQCNITPSQQLHQESDRIERDIASASPTPKAKSQGGSTVTPTSRRSNRVGFLPDSDEEADEVPKPASASRNKAKRRSLPKSFSEKSSSNIETTSVPSNTQNRGLLREQRQVLRRQAPAKETPDDVIDRFCSLGYPKDIVLQALRATTWRLGDAGQVMEILKRGEGIPQRAQGVWTQRDDEALELVARGGPPKNEKEERKHQRAQKRLEKKHGPALMELRRKYLWEVV